MNIILLLLISLITTAKLFIYKQDDLLLNIYTNEYSDNNRMFETNSLNSYKSYKITINSFGIAYRLHIDNII